MAKQKAAGAAKAKADKPDKFAHLSPEVQELLKREQECHTRIATLGEKERALLDTLQEEKKKLREANEDVYTRHEEAIEAKLRQKQKLIREKEALFAVGSKQMEIDRAVDALRRAHREADRAHDDARRADLQMKLVLTQIEMQRKQRLQLTDRRGHKKVEFTSASEVQKQIGDADQKLKKAIEKGHEAVVKELGNKKNALTNALALVRVDEEIKVVDAKIAEHFEECKSWKAIMLEKEELKDTLEAESKKKKEALAALRGDDNKGRKEKEREEKHAKRDEINQTLDKLSKDIDEIKRARTNEMYGGKIDDSAVQEIRAEKTKLKKELDQIKSEVPTETMDVDTEFVSAILGKDGATVSQLSSDFSCVIDIWWNQKQIALRGCPADLVDDCKEAITAIIEGAKASRLEEDVPFDKTHIGELLRVLTRWEKTTQARIHCRKEEGVLKIVGAADEIQMAKELLQEFEANLFSRSVDVDESVTKSLRGKLLMQIQANSGSRNVFLNRVQHKITCQGKKECVDAAVAQVEELVKKMSECKLEIGIPKGVLVRDIVGPKGKNIQAIQADTETFIDLGGPQDPVLVMGSQDGVDKAKELLRSLFQEIRKEEVFVKYDEVMLPLLLRLEKTSVARPEEAAAAAAEGDAEPAAEAAEAEAAPEAEAEAETKDEEAAEEAADAAVAGDAEDEAAETKEGDAEPAADAEAEVVADADADADAKEGAEAEAEAPKGNGADKKAKKPRRTAKPAKAKAKMEKSLCILERVRRETGCEQVQARRAEGHVLLLGSKEQVEKARVMLETFLVERKLEKVSVSVSGALLRHLASKGKNGVLQRMRAQKGVTDVYPQPDAGTVSITGSADAVEAAQATLKEAVDAAKEGFGEFEFERARAAAIVGPKGSVINQLEKDHKATLTVDRVAGKVLIVAPSAEKTQAAIAALEAIIAADKEKNPVVQDVPPGEKGGKKGGKGEKGGKKGGKGGEKGSGKGSKGSSKGGKKGGDRQ